MTPPPCPFCGSLLDEAHYNTEEFECPTCKDNIGSLFFWSASGPVFYFLQSDEHEVEVRCSPTETTVTLAELGGNNQSLLAKLDPMSFEEAVAYFTAARIQALASYA